MHEVQVISSTGLEATSRAEIDVQVRTAKMYPRNVEQAKKNSLAVATSDPVTAASMWYELPRAGKKIMGGSVRLAEVLASQWGNLRVATRVVDIGESFVSVEGVCHDLETNVAYRSEVRRKILSKEGNRYGEDMILTTTNAASAIAFREAVFKAVPRAYWYPIYEASLLKSQEAGKSLAEARKNMIGAFEAWKVPKKAILDYLEVKSVEEIGNEDIGRLRSVYTQIKEGEKQIEDFFPNFNQATNRERTAFWQDVEREELNDFIPATEREDVRAASKERLDEILELAKAAKEMDEPAPAPKDPAESSNKKSTKSNKKKENDPGPVTTIKEEVKEEMLDFFREQS